MSEIEILCQDVRTLESEKKFDLAFCDPPFNIGQQYAGFSDKLKPLNYSDFTFLWIAKAWRLLGENGVLALHGPDSLAEDYLRIPRELGGKRIAWCNLHYRFGQCGRGNWIDARCHCIFFAKGKDFIWNPESVLVESDRVKYGDKRVSETERGGKRLPGTVWGVPSDGSNWGRIQGDNAERWSKKNGAPVDHPNQLPIVYMSRIIKAYTNEGSNVLDCFGGSGTTPLVCQALGRNCLSVDVSQESVDSARLRLIAHEKVSKERSK
jgi:site-specific DNA-methyltransferase (adenine-specific)